jgi:hypothetical protein
MSDRLDEFKALRRRWRNDEPRWSYVLETFWTLDYQQMVERLSLYGSLDEAVAAAERERDGMVAT